MIDYNVIRVLAIAACFCLFACMLVWVLLDERRAAREEREDNERRKRAKEPVQCRTCRLAEACERGEVKAQFVARDCNSDECLMWEPKKNNN